VKRAGRSAHALRIPVQNQQFFGSTVKHRRMFPDQPCRLDLPVVAQKRDFLLTAGMVGFVFGVVFRFTAARSAQPNCP